MQIVVPKDFTIETSNYLLRGPQEVDIEHIFTATRYEGFNDGMLWDPPPNKEALMQPLLNNIVAWEKGDGYAFTITKRDSNKLLGRISIRKTKTTDVYDVGFWTHPTVQGKGLMTESLSAIIGFGFRQLSATRIEACHAIWNKASEKVLLRNNMKFVAFIKNAFQKQGKWVDENKLAIEKKDWEGINLLE